VGDASTTAQAARAAFQTARDDEITNLAAINASARSRARAPHVSVVLAGVTERNRFDEIARDGTGIDGGSGKDSIVNRASARPRGATPPPLPAAIASTAGGALR